MTHGGCCSAPPFAAVSLSGKRRKGKVMTPEQESIFREKLKALSPAELQALRDMAQASIMKAHKVTDVDGKKVGAANLRMRSRASADVHFNSVCTTASREILGMRLIKAN